MKRGAFLLALSLCLSAVPEIIRAGDDGYRWLERMGAAMNQMNYQGTFVYMQGDNVESMRITHVVDSQGVHERMVSVSGSPDEVVRDADGVRWISGENRTVMADTSARQGFFPQLPLGDSLRESESYELKLGGSKRIAGHNGSRLSITVSCCDLNRVTHCCAAICCNRAGDLTGSRVK
jgi:sigma-E factor negative regulatory protein RseB